MKAYKWKVSEKPTGRFKAFSHRAWPALESNDEHEQLLAQICHVGGVEYTPGDRGRTDLVLFVRIYDYSKGTQGRSSGKSLCTFKSIAEAKAWAEKVFAKYPQKLPEHMFYGKPL